MDLFNIYPAQFLCLAFDIVQNVGRILQRLLNTLLLLALPLGLALNFCLPSALTLWICHQKPGGWGLGSA